MASLNKAMIIGNLGKDPEVKYKQSGQAVTSFSVATTFTWKDKQSGEKREKVEWHRVKAFGRLAEICGEYLAKGRQVYVEGRLQTSSWEKEGITRYTTEIVADTMQMLGRAENSGYQGNNQNQQPAGNYNSGYNNNNNNYNQNSGYNAGPPMPEPPDDDIPF